MSVIARFSGVKPHTLYRQYKHHSSDFHDWDQRGHARQYMIFPENTGPNLSIDEVSLSNGELYTYVTNKDAKGRKGSLVASIEGTRAADIRRVLSIIDPAKRAGVQEISMDMAANMASAALAAFPNARQVTDRFHVTKLVLDAVQHVRIQLRWMELDKENSAIAEAKAKGQRYKPEELINGDTPKQLLARLRYALYRRQNTGNAWLRLKLAFSRYPQLREAWVHGRYLLRMYDCTSVKAARKHIKRWIKMTFEKKIKDFYTVARSLQYHLETIVNFFHNRTTNASAESFNAKIKLFRAKQRGVSDPEFFLFRLAKLFG